MIAARAVRSGLDAQSEMCEHRFEVIEHTADKGIRACGNTAKEALENAAFGVFSLMAELELYQPDRSVEIELEAPDAEILLHSWLSELLFGLEVEGILPIRFEVLDFSEWRVRARVAARKIGPDVQWLGSPVKAITFHELKFEASDSGWIAQAIVDV
jgi:SHS2 domain-containing protein